jgi:hypothetical protein
MLVTAPPAKLSRRSAVLGALLAIPAARMARAAPVMAGIPANRQLRFQVMRGDSVIGSHALTFSGPDAALTVDIAIKIAVSVGPVTVFRYEMQGRETWTGGQFASLTTTTNDDGKHRAVSIRRAGDGLFVQSAGFPDRTLPGRTTPLTHWSLANLSGPLLSPEDGQPIEGAVTPAGRQTIQLADGRAIAATGYDIAIHTPTRDWYDDDKIWAGLQAKPRDGSVIDYRRTT